MSKLVNVVDDTFDNEVIKSDVPVEEIAAEYDGKVKIAKIDVADNQLTSSRYSVLSLPSIMFFREGKVIDQLFGMTPGAGFKIRLVDSLNKILK